MLRQSKALVLAVVILAVGVLFAAPAAEACCRPCGDWCKTASRTTPCCTGIPTPDDACGLTTCGKWLAGSPLPDTEESLLLAPVSSSQAGDCPDVAVTPEEPAEPAPAPQTAD